MSIAIKHLTLSFQALTQLRFGFSVGSQAGFRVEFVGHGGGGDNGLQAASAALGHVLLRVE